MFSFLEPCLVADGKLRLSCFLQPIPQDYSWVMPLPHHVLSITELITLKLPWEQRLYSSTSWHSYIDTISS